MEEQYTPAFSGNLLVQLDLCWCEAIPPIDVVCVGQILIKRKQILGADVVQKATLLFQPAQQIGVLGFQCLASLGYLVTHRIRLDVGFSSELA